MNCDIFQSELFQPELSPQQLQSLRLHAETCDKCQQRWQQYLLLEEATQRWQQQNWNIDVTDAVLHSIARENSTPRQINGHQRRHITPSISPAVYPDNHSTSRTPFTNQRSNQIALLAVIASLLLMLFSLGIPAGKSLNNQQAVKQNSAVQPQQVIAKQQKQPPSTPTPLEPLPELGTALRDAGSAYWALASEARTIISQARILLPDTLLPGEQNQPLDFIDPNLNRNLQQQLEPLENQVDDTIDFLIKKIPLELYPTT